MPTVTLAPLIGSRTLHTVFVVGTLKAHQSAQSKKSVYAFRGGSIFQSAVKNNAWA